MVNINYFKLDFLFNGKKEKFSSYLLSKSFNMGKLPISSSETRRESTGDFTIDNRQMKMKKFLLNTFTISVL